MACTSIRKVHDMQRVLVFTKSSGYEHSIIKREGDSLSHAERIITELGRENGFEVTATKDGRIFTPQQLRPFDAFVFCTTGDLTTEGTDKQPPMPADGKRALLDAVASGKGFIGFHNAADTFHSPKGSRRLVRPADDSIEVDPYIAMVGGEFLSHGEQQKATIRLASPGFPGMQGVSDFELHEEWYAYRNLARDLHVTLIQDTAGMHGEMYAQPPYPAAWARRHGDGRVYYTGLAHREDVWDMPQFQRIILGGMKWAIGQVDADAAPNMAQLLPHLLAEASA
jgi:uncharacterized protein